MKTILYSLLLVFFALSTDVHSEMIIIKETNTPIALHYAGILQDYISFIKPKLHPKADLISITKDYFNSKGYRVVTISIHSTTSPKLNQSWKPPHTKLAVLPRMICRVLPNEATVELFDQGDEFVLIQNHTGQPSADTDLLVSIGITHMWK